MKDTAIFDLDGLLIDSEGIFHRVFNTLLNDENKEEILSLEDYVHHYSGRPLKENVPMLIQNFHLSVDSEKAIDTVCIREGQFVEEGVPLKKGAIELLAYLKEHHFKIGLATSSKHLRAEKILRKNNVLDYFSFGVFSKDVTNGKPAPDVFLIAQEKANAKKENCIIFEDSEAGIEAANAAGIDVICVPDLKIPDEKTKELATAILPSLKDAIAWLDEHNK